MNEILIDTARDAIREMERLYFSDSGTGSPEPTPRYTLGQEFSVPIRLPEGYHSEIPAQFLDSYRLTNLRLLRLAALILNGRADIKTLTTEQIEELGYSVKVTEGSSNFLDNAKDILQEILGDVVGKMDGNQALIAVLGVAALGFTTWGWTSYLKDKQHQRETETSSKERTETLRILEDGREAQAAEMRRIVEIMSASGDPGRHAAATAEAINSDRLRAAASTNVTEIAGDRLTQSEA